MATAVEAKANTIFFSFLRGDCNPLYVIAIDRLEIIPHGNDIPAVFGSKLSAFVGFFQIAELPLQVVAQHKGQQFFLTQFHNSHSAVQSNCRFGILQTIHYENFDYL